MKTAAAISPLAGPMLVLGVLPHWYLPRVGLWAATAGVASVTAIGLLCMRLVTVESGYVAMDWPILVTSLGVGLCSAAVTSAITSAVRDEEQGVASAVNDTTREVGAALGVAVAGSVVAALAIAIWALGLDGQQLRIVRSRAPGRHRASNGRAVSPQRSDGVR